MSYSGGVFVVVCFCLGCFKNQGFHEYFVYMFESAQGKFVLGEAEPWIEVEFKAFKPEEVFVRFFFMPMTVINQIKWCCLKLSE